MSEKPQGGSIEPSAARAAGLRLLAPVAVFVCALLVRLLYLAQDSTNPFFWQRLIDADSYHQLALRFAGGDWPASEAMFRPPLYPVLLGLVYRAFGTEIMVVKALQAILGSLGCVLVYWIGLLVFSRRVAVLAAGLCAFCGTLVYYDGEPLSASLDVFLLLLGVLAAVRAALRPRPGSWALVGTALGLGAINRGSLLLFVPFVLAWIWWRHDGQSRSSRLFNLASFLATLAMVMAPVAWHNARFDESPERSFTWYKLPPPTPGSDSTGAALRRLATGQVAWLGWADGVNAYLGNTPEVQEINRDDHRQHFVWFAELMTKPWQAGLHSAVDHSHYFTREVMKGWLEHPGARLRLLGRKILQVFNGTEIPRGRRPYAERAHSSLLSILLWRRGLAFPTGLLIPFGVMGLWLARSSWRRHGLLAAALMAQIVFLLAFFVTARYRAPALPLLALYAAYALFEVRTVVRARRVGLMAVLAGLLLMANLPLDPIEEQTSAVEEYDLGTALLKQDRVEAAILHFERALLPVRADRIFPNLHDGTTEFHYNLAVSLHRVGQLDRALEHYRAALALDPENRAIQAALAQALNDGAAVRARNARGSTP